MSSYIDPAVQFLLAVQVLALIAYFAAEIKACSPVFKWLTYIAMFAAVCTLFWAVGFLAWRTGAKVW